MTYRPPHALNIEFAVLGARTIRRRSGVHWWTTETPEGAATIAFRQSGDFVRADGWGPGTDWGFTHLPRLLGADDDLTSFRPTHPLLREIADRFGSVRIGATDRWYEAVATTAIGQRVVKADASASRETLSRRHGAAALAGPAHMFPTPARMLGLSDHDFHRVGIERSRARVLRVAAKYADRIERLESADPADAGEWLERLPGIGPWTTGWTVASAGGGPDSVPTGDLHLPRMVTHALTGKEGDDDAMLEALEPYAGHRHRVVRMVKVSGAGPARHAPAPFRYDISRI